MTGKSDTADVPIYQIKVTLEDSKPPIWRRLLVRSDVTLADLHDIIQAACGWWDRRLHVFIGRSIRRWALCRKQPGRR